jgi:hypothetical protein
MGCERKGHGLDSDPLQPITNCTAKRPPFTPIGPRIDGVEFWIRWYVEWGNCEGDHDVRKFPSNTVYYLIRDNLIKLLLIYKAIRAVLTRPLREWYRENNKVLCK